MIPDEAVAAAAEVIQYVDYPDYLPDLELARKVLEAAAPYLLEQGFDEGFTACGWEHTKQRKDPSHPITRVNPYRKEPAHDGN